MTTTILDGETYTEALQRRYAEEAKTDGRMNINELAKEAGIPCFGGMYVVTEPAELERFAALVRADEQIKALEAARTIGGDWAAKFEQEYLK